MKIVIIKKFNSKKFTNTLFKKKNCDKFNKGNDKQLKIIDPAAPE
jgi:hypothetical protein